MPLPSQYFFYLQRFSILHISNNLPNCHFLTVIRHPNDFHLSFLDREYLGFSERWFVVESRVWGLSEAWQEIHGVEFDLHLRGVWRVIHGEWMSVVGECWNTRLLFLPGSEGSSSHSFSEYSGPEENGPFAQVPQNRMSP